MGCAWVLIAAVLFFTPAIPVDTHGLAWLLILMAFTVSADDHKHEAVK